MNVQDIECQICLSKFAKCRGKASSGDRIDCPRCTEFVLTDVAKAILQPLTSVERGCWSGWLRENRGTVVSSQLIERLSALKPMAVGEKADRLLARLAAFAPKPGIEFLTSAQQQGAYQRHFYQTRRGERIDFEQLVATAWAADDEELRYLIQDYLAKSQGRISFDNAGVFKISPSGWAYLSGHNPGPRDIGFCAMWFKPELQQIFELGIEPAIRKAGWQPRRIDKVHHNNRIDDEIIATIRRSKFLVADMTGNRGGVYFEAGLAMGLGQQVIWTCREGRLKRVHFDTRQYPFLQWRFDALDEFRQNLQNRIEATIGRGPLSK